MIVEFGINYEWVAASTYRWQSKQSVDLDWVASAQPVQGPGIDATTICMCGGSSYFTINCPYSKFMMMWRDAKGRQCR